MKRYSSVLIFALFLIQLYHFYPIYFFSLDLPSKINGNLFTKLRTDPSRDESIVILNSGILTGEELKVKIDTLLKFNPKVVGINLCDIVQDASLLENAYSKRPEVVLGVCKNDDSQFAHAVRDGNFVTEFKTDHPDYFEFKIADKSNFLREITNSRARSRINYYGTFNTFHHFDLADIDNLQPEFLDNKTVLIGYCGDHVSLMDTYLAPSQAKPIQNHKSARATPLNDQYEYAKKDQYLYPDIYDIQISANIIRMINEQNFITEINGVVEQFFIIACALLLAFLITIIRTRWLLVDLFIYLVCYWLIIMGGTFLIVVAFDHNYYFEIPGFSVVVTGVGIFTILYNLPSRKKVAHSAVRVDSQQE